MSAMSIQLYAKKHNSQTPDKGFYEYEIIFKTSKTTLCVIYSHLVPLHSNLVKSCREVFSTKKPVGKQV